jgi:hypothetical protein
MAKKLDFEKKFKQIFKSIEEDDPITTANDYFIKASNQPLISYTRIVEKLITEFKEWIFVFIFDQFESVRMSFINRLDFYPTKLPRTQFHVVVSFSVEETKWSDETAIKLYEMARRHFSVQGAEEKVVEGINQSSIGEWIYNEKKRQLSEQELNHIWRNSIIRSCLPNMINRTVILCCKNLQSAISI